MIKKTVAMHQIEPAKLYQSFRFPVEIDNLHIDPKPLRELLCEPAWNSHSPFSPAVLD